MGRRMQFPNARCIRGILLRGGREKTFQTRPGAFRRGILMPTLQISHASKAPRGMTSRWEGGRLTHPEAPKLPSFKSGSRKPSGHPTHFWPSAIFQASTHLVFTTALGMSPSFGVPETLKRFHASGRITSAPGARYACNCSSPSGISWPKTRLRSSVNHADVAAPTHSTTGD